MKTDQIENNGVLRKWMDGNILEPWFNPSLNVFDSRPNESGLRNKAAEHLTQQTCSCHQIPVL